MKKILLATALLVSAALPAMAQTAPQAGAQPFALAPLPYAMDALEPVIDRATMELHYGKHHQAYINNLNAEIAKTPELQGKSLEEIVRKADDYSDAVRNNAGGHWNHTFFWSIMKPAAQSGAPSPELLEGINKNFGSLDAFKQAFEKAGAGRFGSGWVWLIVNKGRNLEITTTRNQDNPLMDDADDKGIPVLGNDVWEHAYYLQYNNRRADYLRNWWQVVNWKQVSDNYAAAMAAAR